MKIKFTGDYVPSKKNDMDACYDIRIKTIEYYRNNIKLPSWLSFIANNVRIDTGLSIEITESYLIPYLSVLPRSGVSKHGWILGNCEGIIDELYRSTIKAVFWKVSGLKFPYKAGERFAQVKVQLSSKIEWIKVDELSETNRGPGFGSSGNE